jgi:predicted transcriptional regulator of viral defense system
MQTSIENYITIREAAEIIGVTPQRFHKLISTYGLSVQKLTPRMTLVAKREIKKIPTNRPSGRKLTAKKN